MILSRKWLEERRAVFVDYCASDDSRRLASHDCACNRVALVETALYYEKLAHDFAEAAEGMFRAYDKAIATMRKFHGEPGWSRYCDKLRELLARMEVKEK